MTDKEYVKRLQQVVHQLDRMDQTDQDYTGIRDLLLGEIHDMNISWKAGRRWQHWHYIVKLIILVAILAFVVWTVLR